MFKFDCDLCISLAAMDRIRVNPLIGCADLQIAIREWLAIDAAHDIEELLSQMAKMGQAWKGGVSASHCRYVKRESLFRETDVISMEVFLD